ncbi:hypothetical protein N7532_006552 [Penicillium argentinense]|uniref:Uncharacterized protein n=1 Tax=Penicillium argentinense TaxID=1131581 RepID=A0A9W9FG67_9EURO|nr:uncharacterized protein N7532_006552 [Penicillium argentinense]KAJ5099551.1 hypothetical protein N7532_006552 [Penicillium argentinense]
MGLDENPMRVTPEPLEDCKSSYTPGTPPPKENIKRTVVDSGERSDRVRREPFSLASKSISQQDEGLDRAHTSSAEGQQPMRFDDNAAFTGDGTIGLQREVLALECLRAALGQLRVKTGTANEDAQLFQMGDSLPGNIANAGKPRQPTNTQRSHLGTMHARHRHRCERPPEVQHNKSMFEDQSTHRVSPPHSRTPSWNGANTSETLALGRSSIPPVHGTCFLQLSPVQLLDGEHGLDTYSTYTCTCTFPSAPKRAAQPEKAGTIEAAL